MQDGPGDVLVRLLQESRLITAPGVYDGLSARIAEEAGFEVIYMSGGAVARSGGTPDVGLLTLSEICDRARQIIGAVKRPVLIDIDTGYGGPLNAARAVSELVKHGAAGVHIEDQVMPKRCGHYDEKDVVDAEVMIQRLRACILARDGAPFVIIARTDALAVEGIESAIRRANQYADAGADMIFIEAPRSRADLEQIATAVRAPLVVNMFFGGRTPLIPPGDLQAMGYRLMLVPSDLQRAAIHAMRARAANLLAHGPRDDRSNDVVSFVERDRLVRLDDYLEFERRVMEPLASKAVD